MGVGLETDGNSRVNGVQKKFSGGRIKFRWRIRVIAHLWSLAVVHHRLSLFFLCYVASDDVDLQYDQATAILDPSLENNRRVPPTIEGIHPGIWRPPRPG